MAMTFHGIIQRQDQRLQALAADTIGRLLQQRDRFAYYLVVPPVASVS